METIILSQGTLRIMAQDQMISMKLRTLVSAYPFHAPMNYTYM